MTIGPAPMIRIDLMSLRFGIGHQFREAIEEISDVVRPGARLRMALETERWTIRPCQSLEGTVEERYVRRPEGFRYRGRINREAVVLTGDHYLPGVEVLHRVVRAVVAELHLECLRPRREA